MYNYGILTTFGTQNVLKRKYQSYILFDLQLVPLLLNFYGLIFKIYKLHVKTK